MILIVCSKIDFLFYFFISFHFMIVEEDCKSAIAEREGKGEGGEGKIRMIGNEMVH